MYQPGNSVSEKQIRDAAEIVSREMGGLLSQPGRWERVGVALMLAFGGFLSVTAAGESVVLPGSPPNGVWIALCLFCAVLTLPLCGGALFLSE